MMEKKELTVNTGQRLDLAMTGFDDISRSGGARLIAAGNVSVNGDTVTSKKYMVRAGDIVSVEMPEPVMLEAAPENIPLDIIYEDDSVIVINKPAGMVVHPAAGNETGTMVNALMYHCKDSLSSINGVIRPGIVHRIDKDTSGVLVAAKTDAAHNSLAEQFAKHSITRIYTALVYNNIKEDEGFVEAPIGRDPVNRLKQAVTEQNSKYAYTGYRVLERFGKYTLVQAELKTGRTHQIRVHMAYIKHPLVGDRVYGPEKDRTGAKRQMLHAGVLGFQHPATGKYIEFSAPLPEDFTEILDRMRRGVIK